MYNKRLEEREIPKTWKYTTITPMIKEGKILGSYRPKKNTLQNISKDDKQDLSGTGKIIK